MDRPLGPRQPPGPERHAAYEDIFGRRPAPRTGPSPQPPQGPYAAYPNPQGYHPHPNQYQRPPAPAYHPHPHAYHPHPHPQQQQYAPQYGGGYPGGPAAPSIRAQSLRPPYQPGHVLHLANDINPTVLPIIGMPRSSPTVSNQQWKFVPINGPLASEGFIESGVQPGGIFLSAQIQSTPTSMQAIGQQPSLFLDFGNCINATAGSLLVVNETSNTTLALTAWPMQSPELTTPVTYEEYFGLESQIWNFIPA
ncbi:hypothetical protein B0H13DRAFT_2689052 [Mycena leptocephala]|nr:hypothetical protein B0H13DRAFT_2689052 [Mycena leptocephala]